MSHDDLGSILDDSLSFFNQSLETVSADSSDGQQISQIALDSSKNNMVRCMGSLESVLKGSLVLFDSGRRRALQLQ